jgi:transcriptional regulator with XRE-family HTH domain
MPDRKFIDPATHPLAFFLRATRLEAGLGLNAVAKAAHISAPYLSDLELGRRLGIGEAVCERLARALGVPLKELHQAAVKQELIAINARRRVLLDTLKRIA